MVNVHWHDINNITFPITPPNANHASSLSRVAIPEPTLAQPTRPNLKYSHSSSIFASRLTLPFAPVESMGSRTPGIYAPSSSMQVGESLRKPIATTCLIWRIYFWLVCAEQVRVQGCRVVGLTCPRTGTNTVDTLRDWW